MNWTPRPVRSDSLLAFRRSKPRPRTRWKSTSCSCSTSLLRSTLKPGGKAAVVVPTGFITAQADIDKGIREHLVKHKMLAGVVSMPSNIFATTGTNMSILFIDASNKAMWC
ncbi:N-6 DNA methylase [Nitrosomonas communis]|uniref:N-6 DNA methylase n=1 Tax=Nitrosomonas communis TaxID=44574 RepID=UPI0035273CFA